MNYLITSQPVFYRCLLSTKSKSTWSPLINIVGYCSLSQKHHKSSDCKNSNDRRRSKTGLIFDTSMIKHKCLWDENFPERPERFNFVLNRLKHLGLVDRSQLLKPRLATKKEILYIHSEKHYEQMKALESINDPVELEELSAKYDSVYFHPETQQIALLAAGSTIELVDAIIEDKVENGFALVRPPGHHAFADKPCGYCYYNNVALGAARAIKEHGLERVLIVDWDVHHGQATQFSFEDKKEVLYFSIHKYLKGAFWPNLKESNYTFSGRGPGLGYSVNVPLNATGLTDHDYLAIFHNILLPIAYEYNPQLILISAGYDAAIGCTSGKMSLSPTLYAHLTNQLMTFAEGKVCAILEGGYCLSSLADGAALTLRTLLGDPCPPLPNLNQPVQLHSSTIDSILNVIWALKPHWESLRIQEEFVSPDNQFNGNSSSTARRYTPIVEYNRRVVPLDDSPKEYRTRGFYPIHDKETFDKFETIIQQIREETDLTTPLTRTCINFDFNVNSHRHEDLNDPECPERILSIYEGIKNKGLLDDCVLIEEGRSATDDELKLVHSDEYISKIKSFKRMEQGQTESHFDPFETSPSYVNKNTNAAARLAVGALLQVTDQVLTDKSRNGFAIIRPPGHHATEDSLAGFCIFNNIAIAVEYAIQKYNIKRVLTLDWDIHHGDGTQSIFANHPNVQSISLHRYDSATFYPYKVMFDLKTESNIINIPWNGGPMSNIDYLLAFTNIVLPIAYEYDPEVVFVSSGFDAVKNDPLGQYKLDPEFYGHFSHLLSGLARGKIIIALEGGYNLNAITNSAVHCVSALTGKSPKSLGKLDPVNENARKTIRDVMSYHSANYSSLAFNVQLPPNKLTG